METILIKGALLCGQSADILLEGQHIKRVAAAITEPAGTVIDAGGKAALPGLVNMHTHAAMTLFRGYGDDMPLMPWLETKIWPNEAKLTADDVYWGSKLACLEMIKSGTTNFLDMYQDRQATKAAVAESGMRATLSYACMDMFSASKAEQIKAGAKAAMAAAGRDNPRVRFALGPHAPYTVSAGLLQWLGAFAAEHGLPLHMHVAETQEETENAKRQFGLSPVRYLRKLGLLSPRLIIAHALYVDDDEIKMLADAGVKVVHNPAANMKLGSGARFKFTEMRAAGIPVALGTDGCSSSNNLDMVEAMKLAALLGKAWRQNPEVLTAREMLFAASRQGAEMLGINAGEIKAGALADLSLVNLRLPAFTPNFDFVSNLVYAANGSCIDTVICNGKILMQNGHIDGEEEIIERAAKTAYDLMKR